MIMSLEKVVDELWQSTLGTASQKKKKNHRHFYFIFFKYITTGTQQTHVSLDSLSGYMGKRPSSSTTTTTTNNNGKK